LGEEQAAVIAFEKVTLYGLPIVVKRKVNYGRIDPALSRELFIRQALVEGEWETRHKFFHDNRELLEEVEELEHRARRPRHFGRRRNAVRPSTTSASRQRWCRGAISTRGGRRPRPRGPIC
jgi:HrpA-like RNA helicase